MSLPNIIYILADDMGYGDVGANNSDSKISTPHLDRLAAEGMRFTDAHAASSVCTPSRYSILTGRYCWRTSLKRSVLWPWDPPLIEPRRLTAASLLRQQGYRTACLGKWHLGWQWATLDGQASHKGAILGKGDIPLRHSLGENIDFTRPARGGPVDCGFDTYFGVDVPNFPPYAWFQDDHLTALPTEQKPDAMFGQPGRMVPGWTLEAMIPEFVRRARTYIADAGPEPFFLYFALTSPHTPIVPNEPFIGRSGAGLYGDFVCEVDWVVGEVLQALDGKSIADNTLVIFTSDNGPECLPAAAGGTYEHARRFGHYSMADLRGVKRDTWEGGHRVPFVARWPDVTPAGTVCDQLTGLIDLIATCADIAGQSLPTDQAEDSTSILPLLRGRIDKSVRDVMVHHSCRGDFALRRGQWVFIDAPSGDDISAEPQWFKDRRGYTPHDHPGELYDLQTDVSERSNLYGRRADVVEKLSTELAGIKQQAGPPPPRAATPGDDSE